MMQEQEWWEGGVSEPLFTSVYKRLPWLVVLFGLGLLVSGVVSMFETVVENLALIVSYQSLILGMAGNVGTQSLAVTVRLLAKRRLTARQKVRLLCQEMKIGLLVGLFLGVLSFVLVGCYLMLARGEEVRLAFSVSLCIGIALLLSMCLSALFGAGIPILFQRLRIDPAVSSGPFITTASDLVAVVTYYGFAWILLLQI